MATAVRCLVVAGVSGSGKSTLGQELARRLSWEFAEGDDLHPPSNIAKMRAGVALTDEDRRPWLAAIGERIDASPPDRGLVITCSALRRSYRDQLRAGRPFLLFCLVNAPREILAERLRHRTGHYMPASLLDSQLATLEPLEPDEPGFVVDSTLSTGEAVRSAWSQLDLPG